MKYTPVIGLEVHVELKTGSKMFCANSTKYFLEKPNIHTCPVCLGLPGALPYINEQAIDDCIKIGLALNCQISKISLFERKNYFYPDLPKGYQISQYRYPLCTGGRLKLKNGRVIRINRVHQEEDTAKLFHQNGQTLIDFNRSGVPLVEIVTEPDFQHVEEIKDYAKKLQRIFRYLGVSDADMEKGQMRLEANISMRQGTEIKLPSYRVELKNINSFRFMVQAVEYEIKRQSEILAKGKNLVQETRGWNQNTRKTYTQRVKEESSDYRYFPDPDLPPLRISNDKVKEIQASMPELPSQMIERLAKDYGLTKYQAEVLTDTKDLADFFEESVKVGAEHGISTVKIANTLINKKLDRGKILPAKFVAMLTSETGKSSLKDVDLDRLVTRVVVDNPLAVSDFKKGKINSLEFLLGQVMRLAKTGIDPNQARKAIKKKLTE